MKNNHINKLCEICDMRKIDMNSHIIPKSLLRLVSSEDSGRFVHISGDGKDYTRNGGAYNPSLLCNYCDGVFGKYDSTAQQIARIPDITDFKDGISYIYKGVDPGRLQLFLLSFLWRASKSELPDFKTISIGEKHEQNIKTILKNADIAKAFEYSSIIGKYKSAHLPDHSRMHGWLPVKTRLEKITVYQIYLPNQYKITVKVDRMDYDPKLLLDKLFLTPSYPIPIIDYGSYETSPEFGMLRRIIQARRH